MANTTKRGKDPVLSKDIFSSPTFKFVVGPNQKEFLIHKRLVANMSPVLATLVDGKMREAIEGSVVWDDCDEDTFTRFAEYAYTGSYSPAEPEIHLDHSNIASEASTQNVDGPARKKRRLNLPAVEEDSDSASEESVSDSDSGTDDNENENAGQEAQEEESEVSDASEDSNDSDDDDGDDGDDLAEEDGKQDDSGRAYLRLPFSFSQFVDEYDDLKEESSAQRYTPARDSFGHLFPNDVVSRKRAWQRVVISENMELLKVNNSKYHLIQHFLSRQSDGDVWEGFPVISLKTYNTDPCEVYEEVFLSHARIFVLADKYQIRPLMALASYNIYLALSYYMIHRARVQDLVTLVRYTYANTVEKSLLRDILAHYMACVVEDLKQEEAFGDLMVEMGEFSADMVHYMTQRFAF